MVAFSLLFMASTALAQNTSTDAYNDVPVESWAYDVIHHARDLNIVQGRPSGDFGYGDTVKRSEFVTFLVRIMAWELISPDTSSFIDNQNKKMWYYDYIETALDKRAITLDNGKFRPDENITREEMAVMIVRSLGWDILAGQLSYLEKPFYDVDRNRGYIGIVKDTGIVTGKPGNIFDPFGTAKREEAVAMLMRMYDRLNQPLNTLHAFYAIRSYPQKELVKDTNSLSFGWSRIDYDKSSGQIVLNTSLENNNEYYIPEGYHERVAEAKQLGIPVHLMVTVEDTSVYHEETNTSVGLLEYILTNPEVGDKAIADIVEQVILTQKYNNNVSFDGVVIDFESMRGSLMREAFNKFLLRIKEQLTKNGKSLYVAVHPKRRDGQAYYDGYDYRKIGEIADKVILMAHDYNAKTLTQSEMDMGYNDTPLTPQDEVYYALREITNKETGVADTKKVLLQLSFDSAQWKLKDGKVLNKDAYRPGYDLIRNTLMKYPESLKYSNVCDNPYINYFNNEDGTTNIIWYEDSRSVLAKIKMAKMFGVDGISVWRLGIIPDFNEPLDQNIYLDVWEQIINSVKN